MTRRELVWLRLQWWAWSFVCRHPEKERMYVETNGTPVMDACLRCGSRRDPDGEWVR